MELKSERPSLDAETRLVLIVPLWNWNLVGGIGSNDERSLNCTFMELKSVVYMCSVRGHKS